MRRLYKLVATILVCVVGASASAQIVVTFTGRDSTNQYHIPLHHVDVFNLDQLWEEVLYYPDTTLILGTVGVDDYELLTGFELKQNVPNPFDGTTEFALVLPEGRDVLLEIYDITGKLAVGKHFSALPSGTHLFQATLTSPQTYLLSAKLDNGQMTIKMVNEGHGAGNSIRYLGMTDANGDYTLYLKDDKTASGYPFSLGDEMKYIGYAEIDDVMRKSNTILRNQNANEIIPLRFEVSAPSVNTKVPYSITATTAASGVQVVSNGGAAIKAWGICWSTSSNPTIDDDTISGFTGVISGLSPNTTYHVRAFATNSVGTAYGADESFTTLCDEVNVSITGTTTINYGQFATLFASGANSYQWSTGNAEASITVNPTSTTTYTVTGTNSYGCTDTASVTVVVNFLPPTVITGTVDNITATTAICGGNVVSTGGAAVTERGVCWSTSPNPMASGNHLPIGNGMGSFDDIVTGLTPNTTYHVRAYAINSVGTSYGADSTFTTICDEVNINVSGNTTINYGESANLHASGANTYHWSNSANTQNITVTPTTTTTYTVTGTNIYGCSSTASVTVTVNPIDPVVATNGISSITSTSAKCGGNVMDNGGAPVIERGICWSTSPNPTESGSHLPVGNGTGSFTSIITGLTPNTTYHVRAYATNSVNTSYGGDSTFTTLCDTVNISITGNTTINYGQSAILIASGANSYSWNNGSSTAAITISPTVTTSYTVTGMNIHGCTAAASVTVTVNPIAPTVITNGITNITSTTASCGGTVTDNGGTTVFVRGICWSTSPNPTVSDNSSNNNDGGMGHFSRNISGLNPNTTYHVRAYAINSVDTAYGADSVFTTLCNAVNISIAGNTSIDYGQSTTLTASGTNSYQWSTGANTGSITVSPTAITTYTITGTNSYGCSATASVTITVNYLAPTVTTEVVNDITPTSANCGGNVISDGGKTVTARGICWSTSPNPDVYGSHIFMGSGTGSFSTTVNNLTPNTTYHVRAYAINSVDTAYGADSTFTTLCNTVNLDIAGNTIVSYGESTTLTASGANSYHWSTNANNESISVSPTTTTTYTVTGTNLYGCTATASVTVTVNFLAPVVVTNNDVNSITSASAICGGTVTSDGGASVTARGVCWSTSPNPTVSACCTTNDGGGMGSFTSYITGLTPGTTYYVRAYATNSEGTSYGEPRTFTTHTTPTVTTATVTDVTGHTAICGGTVTGDGGTSVTVRGVCWSISENPTINDSHTNDGNGVGSFTSNITGLSEGITYHVRAYATNNVGTSYGADITFTTPLLPTVITDSISNITDSTAICGGVVVSDGGATVTARGVCWSSIPNPTVNDAHTIDGDGMGIFSSSLMGLTAGTMYYVRAYATSVAGTAYGQQVVFATTTPDGTPCVGTPTVTDIDGNIYNTVQIGGQCWMKENLKTTRYANGTNVSMGNSYNYSSSIAYRFNPNYDAYNVPYYGYLYNWTAVMHGTASSDSNPSGVQGICPNGWHVPSVAEWVQLTDYVSSHNIYRCNGIVEDIAKAMSSTTGWVSSSTVCEVGNDQSSNNATGFSIVPAGCFRIGYQSRLGEAAYLWSATEYDAIEAYGGYVDNNSTSMPMATNLFKDAALTVRCVLNSVSSEYSPPPSTFCKTVKIIPVVYNDATEPFCPTYGLLTLTVVDSVTGNPIPNLTYTWSGESVDEASTDSTSYVAIIPEWCDTVYTAFVTVNDGQGCVKNISRTINVASTGPRFIGTLADTIVPRQSGCRCFIPDFRDLITNSIVTDDCFTLSNIKSTSFWYNQSPLAGTELTEESQVVTITITNLCGKSNTITVNVHKSADIPAMVLTSTPNHFCAQTFEKAGDGTITVIAPTSGSGHAYTYKIFDANDNELSIPNFPITLTQYWLSHQTYRVQAYESTTGCSVSDTITVSHNPYSVDFSFMITPNTACSSVTGNGSITVTNPTSTNPNPDFTYSIDGVHFTTVPVFNNLMDGTYSVYVKDVTSECVAEKLAGIGLVDTIPPTISIDHPIRLYPVLGDDYSWNSPDSITFVNAVVPYISDNCTDLSSLINSLEFFWENTTESPIGATGIFQNMNHRTITVKVTDGSGNSTETVTFYIDFPDAVPCSATPTVIDIDGNTYNTVQIGGQCWMKENLRTTKYADGTSIPIGFSTSNISPYYYDYTTSGIPLAERGYLYNWPAVMHGVSSSSANPSGVQGICPTGWHVPSDAEWTQLTDYVSSQSEYMCGSDSSYISKALASTSGWWSYSDNCAVGNDQSENNSTGFNALPAGVYSEWQYNGLGYGATFWSATLHSSSEAYSRGLTANYSTVSRYSNDKHCGFSIRCLRDETSTVIIDEKSCPGTPTVTDHEGNVYATVQIGEQCWMRENLRTTTSPSTGTYLIPSANIGYTYTGKQARWYNNDSATYAPMNYGLLYNWNAVVDTFNTAYGETSVNGSYSYAVSVNFTGYRRGICPAGWHIPSDAEWTQLTNYVKSQSEYVCGTNSDFIAKALADSVGWSSSSGTCDVGNNQSTNNATGFGVVPAGNYGNNGYCNSGENAEFWSSTEAFSYNACFRGLVYDYDDFINYGSTNKRHGFSARCLRDESSTATLPTVTTVSATAITATSATCGGNVTSNGGANVTARGVCWSTSHNPTIEDAYTTDGVGTGDFSSNLAGLTPNTTYYVRAYATNSTGTAYGEEVSFTTTSAIPANDGQPCLGSPTVTDIDGNTYNTVQIGGQCWMKENLRTTKYADGTAILAGSDSSSVVPYYYNYSTSSIPLEERGYLYNWSAVMHGASSNNSLPSDIQGICPHGWHMPSDAEWSLLTNYVSSQSQYVCNSRNNYIAKSLAGVLGWTDASNTCSVGNDQSSNNTTGFGAVPAGYYIGSYNNNSSAYFWSSTEDYSGFAWGRCLTYYSVNMYRNSYDKSYGCSVRCLRDFDSLAMLPTVITNRVRNVAYTAICGGNVTSDGNSPMTIRGICWGSEHEPTIDDFYTIDGAGLGEYVSYITGLTRGITYYVRAYAINNAGINYGEEVAFVGYYDAQPCAESPTVTDIDGNIYNTVKIGGQCWMKENLRTTKYADGTLIEVGNTTSSVIPYRYIPNNNEDNVSSYGYLYNWPAVMNGAEPNDDTPSEIQGICPIGWHVPSAAECTILTDYANFAGIVKDLADSIGWEDYGSSNSPGHDPTNNNVSGFGARPAGYCYSNNGTSSFGTRAYFWCTTERTSFHASFFYLAYNGAFSPENVYGTNKYYGYSVRCVRNEIDSHSLPTVTTINVTDITFNNATCGGVVTDIGIFDVTSRGVCWSISHNPTIRDSHISNGNGTGAFTVNITGLTSNYTYYLRAYATNRYGTVYGKEVSFTTSINPNGDERSCLDTPTLTDIEGNMYNTILIGNQCWMRENLRTKHYSDSTPITQGNGYSNTYDYWYYPAGYASYQQTYGLLYNWPTVIHGNSDSTYYNRGVCPSGWHVPSDTDWTQLTDYVGSRIDYLCGNDSLNISKALASTMWRGGFAEPCAVGNLPTENNATGFCILPSGNFGSGPTGFKSEASLWTSTEQNNSYAYVRLLSSSSSKVTRQSYYKDYGRSIRCVRDISPLVTTPSIITDSVRNISSSSALCGGNVVSNGGSEVLSKGVCWSTSQNPTIGDNHTDDGSGIGCFMSNMTELTAGMTYYVRAYAKNSVGIAYGEQREFSTIINGETDGQPCSGSLTVTDFDGNTYNTVQIGQQCWMKENLRTTHYANGMIIPLGIDTSSIVAYCYHPAANANNVSSYGYLYNWEAVMCNSPSSDANPSRVQGICPNGWHVPSDAEWIQLTNYVGDQNVYFCNISENIAKSLASKTGWNNSVNNCAVGNTITSNNSTGFCALPAGGYNHAYDYLGVQTYFWSSTENYSGKVWCRNLFYSVAIVNRYISKKSNGCSVRCLRDENTSDPPTVSSLPYSTNFYDDSTWTLNNGTCGNYWATNSTYGLFVTNNGTTPGYNETSPSTVMAEKLLLMPSSDSIHIEFDVRVGGESSYDYLKVFLSPSSTTYTVGTSHNTQSDKSYSTYAVNFSSFKFQTGNSSNPYTFNLTNGTTVHISVNMANPNPNDTAKFVFLWRDDTSVSTQPGAVISQLSVSEAIASGVDGQPCPGIPTVTDIDNNTYNTIQIGNQCWMKENLRTTKYADGEPISQSDSSSTIPCWYYPDNNASNKMTYGLLYNWKAVMYNSSSSDSNLSLVQGVCPNGWHVPSDEEWTLLTHNVSIRSQYLCNNSTINIAKAMASTIGWSSSSTTCAIGNSPSSNDDTNFGVLPAGYYYNNYYGYSTNAFFWSTTKDSNENVWNRNFFYHTPYVNRSSSPQSNAYSVRCLRD